MWQVSHLRSSEAFRSFIAMRQWTNKLLIQKLPCCSILHGFHIPLRLLATAGRCAGWNRTNAQAKSYVHGCSICHAFCTFRLLRAFLRFTIQEKNHASSSKGRTAVALRCRIELRSARLPDMRLSSSVISMSVAPAVSRLLTFP